MIDRTVPVTEEELHAFVDGELAEDRRHDVEQWLATHPEDAARVAAWRAQADEIRALFGGVVDEPVPERLQVERLVRNARPWRRWMAAAALLAFLLGGAGGWYARGMWDVAPAAKLVVSEALDAHRLYVAEMRHAVEVPAESAHLVRWLSKRVGHPLRPPDLKPFNLKLIGGRLLPGPAARGPAALFMYESQSGERFTLFCARAAQPHTALHYRVAGQHAAVYWVESDVFYVLSGPADRDRLHKVAESAYEQIERRQPVPAERSSQSQNTSQVR